MRIVGEANAYVSKTEPFKLKADSEQERLGTVLHTLAQAVSDLNLLMSPFLPHSANRVHAVLGGTGELIPMPQLSDVEDLDGGPAYPVITGDYSGGPRWQSTPVVPGTRSARRPRSSPSSTRRSSTRAGPDERRGLTR